MKITLLSTLCALGCLWYSPAGACENCSAPKAGEDHRVTVTAPVECTLSSTELSDRVKDVAAILVKREEVTELEDGYAVRFPGDDTDLAARLATWVVAERQCCSSMGFELKFSSDQGPVWLTVQGSQEVKELVATLIEMANDAPQEP